MQVCKGEIGVVCPKSQNGKGEGEKQVSKWKKAAAGLMVFMMVLQCAVLYAVAANEDATEFLHERNTVLIDLSQNDGPTLHFVRECPGSLLLSESKADPAAEAAVREVFDEIPDLVQEDYSETLYGSGTVASHGSSITALAMVATYLTGYTYLPDELAHSFAGKAATDAERIEYAANALGLAFTGIGAGANAGEKADNWEAILTALQAGKCAIAQLNAGSLFAEEKHFVVLKGVTESGAEGGTENSAEGGAEAGYRILVLDPRGANYEKEALAEGFASGFDESVIRDSLVSGWIFDKSAISVDIKRYEEPVGGESGGEAAGERYASLELSAVEKQLLARAVCVLGKGECAEGQQAVAEVLLNRLLAEEFPGDVKALVYGEGAPCDVDKLNAAEATEAEYAALERALYGPYLLNESVTDLTYMCHE